MGAGSSMLNLNLSAAETKELHEEFEKLVSLGHSEDAAIAILTEKYNADKQKQEHPSQQLQQGKNISKESKSQRPTAPQKVIPISRVEIPKISRIGTSTSTVELKKPGTSTTKSPSRAFIESTGKIATPIPTSGAKSSSDIRKSRQSYGGSVPVRVDTKKGSSDDIVVASRSPRVSQIKSSSGREKLMQSLEEPPLLQIEGYYSVYDSCMIYASSDHSLFIFNR